MERRLLLQKPIAQLSNNEHDMVSWLCNFGTTLHNQQVVYNQHACEVASHVDKVKGTDKIK